MKKFPDDFQACETNDILDVEQINKYIKEIESDKNNVELIRKNGLMVFKSHREIYVVNDFYVAD